MPLRVTCLSSLPNSNDFSLFQWFLYYEMPRDIFGFYLFRIKFRLWKSVDCYLSWIAETSQPLTLQLSPLTLSSPSLKHSAPRIALAVAYTRLFHSPLMSSRCFLLTYSYTNYAKMLMLEDEDYTLEVGY